MKTDKKVLVLAAVLFTLALLSLWGARLWTYGIFQHEHVEMHGGVAWRVIRDYQRLFVERRPGSVHWGGPAPLTVWDYVRPDVRRVRTTYAVLGETRPFPYNYAVETEGIWPNEKKAEDLENRLAYVARKP